MTRELTERQKGFKEAMAQLYPTGKSGDGIRFLDEESANVPKISTGSLVLDSILSGGFGKGRIIEIYGKESSGKTTIALTTVANVQKSGGNCAFIDAEQAFDPVYASNLGVDIQNLAFAQPSIAEECLQMVFDLANSGEVDLIVIDSVPAMIPKEEFDNDIGKSSIAVLARLMSKALRSIIKACNDNGCTVIFLNQTRDNVGVMFGPATTTPGGKALRFYTSQRIEVKKKKALKDEDDNPIGTEVELKCVKNKISPPFGTGSTVLTFAKGINRPAELFVVASKYGIIEKERQSYYYVLPPDSDMTEFQDKKVEDGRFKIASYEKKTIEELEKNEELYNLIAERTIEALQSSNLVNAQMGIEQDE